MLAHFCWPHSLILSSQSGANLWMQTMVCGGRRGMEKKGAGDTGGLRGHQTLWDPWGDTWEFNSVPAEKTNWISARRQLNPSAVASDFLASFAEYFPARSQEWRSKGKGERGKHESQEGSRSCHFGWSHSITRDPQLCRDRNKG